VKIPSPTGRRRARIEIIPLIDIIFFLLATFVMVSLSMVKNQGLTVNLPSAQSSTPLDRKTHVVITVTEQGSIYLDKQPVALEQLRQDLQRAYRENPELKVFLNGDEKVFFGQAISVLDEIRKIGITKIAIQTKKPNPS
jgi:biopolymer transport protein ExbD